MVILQRIYNQAFAVLCSHANLHTCRVCVSLPLVTHSPPEMPRVQICLKRESFIWICLSIFLFAYFKRLRNFETLRNVRLGNVRRRLRIQIIGEDLIDFL